MVRFGRYNDEIKAAKIVDAAALTLFGTHAFLNYPKQPITSEYASGIQRFIINRFIINRRLRLAMKRIKSEINKQSLKS